MLLSSEIKAIATWAVEYILRGYGNEYTEEWVLEQVGGNFFDFKDIWKKVQYELEYGTAGL
jgi:hypothetical protein